jgi:hypothetical protein
MSDGLHAKMSALSLRKLVSVSFYLGETEVGPDNDFLGCVGQTEANLLDGWTWVQSCACTLLLRYLNSSLVDLGCLSDHDHCYGFDC